MQLTVLLKHKKAAIYSAIVFLMALFLSLLPMGVQANTPQSLYSYTLDGTSGTIANEAPYNTNVSMTLQGNWSDSSFGVRFDGNTTNKQSVGYAKPGSGPTVDVPASQAFGGAVKFKYQAPQNGSCSANSRNVAQIGRFGDGLGQIKMQLSACNVSSTQAFVQCRIAGSNSTSSDLPVTNSQALVDGATYIAKCAKNPDPTSGSGTLQLTVTRVDEVNGNTVTKEDFAITRPGAITVWGYLSVANKYKLPSIANNTDQFVGDIAKVAYCAAGNMSLLDDCLDSEVPSGQAVADPEPEPEPEPDPTPEPTPTNNLIANSSVEQNLTGWAGYADSNVQFLRSQDVAYDGNSSIKVYSAGAPGTWINGGFKDSPATVGNTTSGTVYTASVWVKPTFVGQTILLRMKEWNSGWGLEQDKQHKLVASTTDWQQLQVPLTTTQNGGWLTYVVQGKGMQANETFYADAMALEAQ